MRGLAARVSSLTDASLDGALDLWDSPWRWVIVGRQGVGKSTLLNAWAPGAARATGLGGVTNDSAEARHGGQVFIDTPGLEDVDHDEHWLAELFNGADGAVWVVDGLQPATATERLLLERALPSGMPLLVLVCRADLLGDEAPVVVERVAHLAAPWAPSSVRAYDLRRAPPQAPVAPSPGASPRRVMALRATLNGAVSAAHALLNPGPFRTLDDARLRWREGIDAAGRQTSDAVHRGELAGRGVAEQALTHALTSHRVAFLTDLRHAWPGVQPGLPRPSARDAGSLDAVRSALGGPSATLRAIERQCHSWVVDGELALDLALPEQARPPVHALRALIGELDAAIHGLPSIGEEP